MGNMVYVPQGTQYPPCVAGLSKKQRKFAEFYVETGGRVNVEAARLAGYSEASADVTAHKNLKNPQILAYIKHLVETRITAGIALAWSTLEDVCANGPAATRKAAAVDMLMFGGILQRKLEEKNININLNVSRTPKQVRADLLQLFEDNPELIAQITGAREAIDAEVLPVLDVLDEVDWMNEDANENDSE